MKNKIKQISNNELSELGYLMGRISALIHRDFLHVEQHVPPKFKQQMADIIKAVEDEQDRREEM